MEKERINALGNNGSTEHSTGNKTVPEKVVQEIKQYQKKWYRK